MGCWIIIATSNQKEFDALSSGDDVSSGLLKFIRPKMIP